MPNIKGKDGRMYKGGVAKGYTGLLDRSYQEADASSQKFFSNRRENQSPPKANQSHTNSRHHFSKPSSAFQRKRCSTALARQQTSSQTAIKKKVQLEQSDSAQNDNNDGFKGLGVYTAAEYDQI